MKELHVGAGLEALDGLNKLERAGKANNEFHMRYLEAISLLSKEIKEKSSKVKTGASAQNEQIWKEIEEINLTLEELGKVADSVIETFKKSPANMPETSARAWHIYYRCLRGKMQKEQEMAFGFGLRVGYAFGVMYGR